MKKISLSLVVVFSSTIFLYSQFFADSLVLFSELKFHSGFEKTSVENFLNQKTDSFNLFLSIDENMTPESANIYYNTFRKLMDDLHRKKIDTKKLNKKIKIITSVVEDHFLRKYKLNEFFPVTLRVGTYNCVSASIIYSLIFDELKIPYKLMASASHVYLVANPGENSFVIETASSGFQRSLYLSEFKQQFSYFLQNSRLNDNDDFKNKSIEEILSEQFNDVSEVEFINLPGFQYYNKAIAEMQHYESKKFYELSQKAYFFAPDQQSRILLYNSLLSQIQKSDFSQVSDVDYLVQFLRFKNTDVNLVTGTFNNILHQYLQYTDREDHCKALFNRLSSQINNKQVLDEVSFNYYLQMSYLYQEEDEVEYYIDNALKIKGNNQEALKILSNFLHRQLDGIQNAHDLLNDIKLFQSKYNYNSIQILLKDYEMTAYLKLAEEAFLHGNTETGNMFLSMFENNCRFPINNFQLINTIELTYFSIAVNYFYKRNNPDDARLYANRGLRFLPTSKLLKSVIIY